jgi:hypothetical protein
MTIMVAQESQSWGWFKTMRSDWTPAAAATARQAIAWNVSQQGVGPLAATTETV